MRICIFGASGRTGQRLVRLALDKGYEVTAYVRDRTSLSEHRQLKVVEGAASDHGAIVRVLKDQDVVFCLVGVRGARQATPVCEILTENILDGMRRNEVNRLLVVTGALIGAPQLGPFYRILRKIVPKNILEDRTRQEDLVRKSGVNWTIFRPTRLTDKVKLRPPLRAEEKIPVGIFSSVSRELLANLLLTSIDRGELYRKAVTVLQ